MQNKPNSLLQSLFSTFQLSLKNSSPTRKWLKDKGIDINRIEIGFDTGRNHRGKEESYIKEAVELGLLEDLTKGRYSSFAKNNLVFPLKDEQGIICNLFAQPLQMNQTGYYLNEEQGLYPKYPQTNSKTLIIAENILEASIQLSKVQTKDTSILALDNGNFTDRHKEVLVGLAELETIQFAPYFNIAIQEYIELFVTNHIGKVAFKSMDAYEIENKEPLTIELEKKDYEFQIHNPEYFTYQKENLKIDVLGGIGEKVDHLEVTLKITTDKDTAHGYRNTINLYSRTEVQRMIDEVSNLIMIPSDELHKHIHKLTSTLESERTKEVQTESSISMDVQMPSQRKDKAKEYLLKENLYEQLQTDLRNIGISGEQENMEILFLAMTSRLLKSPLNVIIHATTGSGKSILMETIADCIPKENYLEMTSLSQKSFYHFTSHYLSHKVLLIQDWFSLDPELEYIIRELESKQKLSRYVTTRDKNNALVTTHKEVYGPVSVISATTQNSVYADNANRSIQLYLNESKEQDEAIIKRQLQIAAKTINIEAEKIIKKKLQDVSQLLQPYTIKNIYAPYLKLPEGTDHIRRMNPIYLNLIASITLIHQYQREKEDKYLLTDIKDIEIANRLMPFILLPKLDLLPNANRIFFEQLEKWLKENKLETFNKKQIIRGLRQNPHTAKHHLKALKERGYVQITGGDRYKNGFEYSLVETSDYKQVQLKVQEALDRSLQEIKHRFN